MIRDAEERVQLIRRRRRSKKSGSSDLESAWCKASLAFTLQVQMQLRAGAELARRPVVGPVFKLTEERSNILCLSSDEWGVLGQVIQVRWAGLGWWKCKLVGFTDAYSWAHDDVAPTYIIENVSKEYGTTLYPLRASTVWDRLSKKQQSDVEAAAEAQSEVRA